MEDKSIVVGDEDRLFEVVSQLIDQSHKQVAKAINTAMVYTYYGAGQYIVEYEQNGKTRAEYGKGALMRLSERLTEKYGKGWSYANLRSMRQFYLAYSKMLTTGQQNQTDDHRSAKPTFILPWTHYQIIMREDNPQARRFYELEAYIQQWSKRQLQRQVGSCLYERLALSRDKDEVMRLANEGQVVAKPADIIKDPLVLEFVGLKPDSSYSETDLEKAIIDKLQDFFMECGKGFLFEARQKRFSYDENYFYVDLVLYNRILQCYVLVYLKLGELTHQDFAQMQIYVNYFNRHVCLDFEKGTIGILLCEKKNDLCVEYTLPRDADTYAQRYALCLPDKAELRAKLREWIDEYNELHGEEE